MLENSKSIRSIPFSKIHKKFLLAQLEKTRIEDYGEEKVDGKCLTIKETQMTPKKTFTTELLKMRFDFQHDTKQTTNQNQVLSF